MVITCRPCIGTGIIGGVSCPVCGGDGKIDLLDAAFNQTYPADLLILQGQIWSDILTSLDSIKAMLPNATKLIFAYQIVEVINTTEYAALGDDAKDGLRIHLCCGVLDLDHSGQIYANLMAIFGSSPITKAAIEAL